jgi:DNA-binding NtrC family response regulator
MPLAIRQRGAGVCPIQPQAVRDYPIPRPILGSSQPIRVLLERIEQVGRTVQPVIVAGETGSGKDTVARAIHQVRAGGVFTRIDCRDTNRAEIDRALSPFRGCTPLDTLFLAHVDQLPLILQDQLLSHVTRGQPAGRMLAGSLTELGERAARGHFRPVLYHWLSAQVVRVPALREHSIDIPFLLAYFLAATGTCVELQRGVMDALLTYSWPGNVRELENCASHLVVAAIGGRAYLDDLPPLVREHARAQRTAPLPLEVVEREAIERALAHSNGSTETAAALLGISQRTLFRKIKRHRTLRLARSRAACA